MTTQMTLDELQVDIERVHPNPLNVRSELGDLTELAASIRSHGILEPLIAHVADAPDLGDLVIIAGHRRHAAALEAGLDTVPVVIRTQPDEATLLELMLAENNQRAALDPIDEAKALVAIKSAGRHRSLKAIASAVNRSEQWVAGRLRIVQGLPEDCWPAVSSGSVSISDAIDIAGLDTDDTTKAKLAAVPAEDRARQIRAQQVAAADRARIAEITADYGPLTPAAGIWEHRRAPWPLVELGDSDGQLNVPLEWHRGCPGHIAWIDHHDGEPCAGCTQPLQHVAELGLDHLGEHTRPVAEVLDHWYPSSRAHHQHHCPHHNEVTVAGRTVELCDNPSHHDTDLDEDKIRALILTAAAEAGHPVENTTGDNAERWKAPDDAAALLTRRLVEQLDHLDDWAISALCIDWEPDVADGETLARSLAGTFAAETMSLLSRRNLQLTQLTDGDRHQLAALNAAIAACVDVGDPPPNLDAIRTRIDVITRGEGDDQ